MKQRTGNFIWAALCPLLYLAILWNLVPFVYGIVDDRTMMEIVSGQYLGIPDGHTIFVGYWYSCFVAVLYRLIPNVDWYALCYLILQAGCMSLMLYRLLKNRTGRGQKAVTCLFMVLWCAVLGGQITSQITFTTTAAVLAVTVIFWYMTTEVFRTLDLIILTFLCFLAVEIRFSVFCMILPVCGVIWLFRVWEDHGRDRRHLLMPMFAFGALLLYLLGLFAGYGGEAWRSYTQYNNTRSLIYDYDDYEFPRYEDETELYNRLGIESKSRAKNLYYYNYTADDEITADFFAQYLELRSAQVRERINPVQRLKDTMKGYVKGVLSGQYYYCHLLALIGYGVLLLWYVIRREWKAGFKACCILGVQILLWIYLIYRGRTPDRVLISMNLMLILPLLLLWREELSQCRLPAGIRKAGAGALFVLLCVSAVRYVTVVREENLETSKWNRNVEGLKEYCMEHPENFYFNDVTSMAMSTYNVRLWQQEPYFMNYMSLGDWISFSPLWEQKLQQNGIASVKDALYSQENVYLISGFDRGLEYLASIYENVTFTEVEETCGFKIYKLEFL